MRYLSLFRPYIWFIISTLLSFFLLLSACFLLMHAIPGDPFQDEQGIPQEIIEHLKTKWGLDRPIYEQYCNYLIRALQGDFGVSIRYPSQTVVEIIKTAFPISACLGIQALALAIPMGFFIGIVWAYFLLYGASSHTTMTSRSADSFHFFSSCKVDLGLACLTSLIISIPNFVIAALLQLCFAVWIPLFPVARWGTYSHTILPTIALAVGSTAIIARIAKARAVDIFMQEWVTMARMKGLSEKQVVFGHVVPHVLLPILSYLGPIMTNLFVGSFAIERVYSIPGLGQWFVTSILSRDYPVIAGLTLFYSIILFCCHQIVECLIYMIDGRKRSSCTATYKPSCLDAEHQRSSLYSQKDTKEVVSS